MRRDPRKPTEYQLQAALVEYLRLNALPGVLYLHVPNQQASGPKRGAFLKRMAVIPGAADLLLMRSAGGGAYAPTNCYVLWLELKAPGKKPTKAQIDFRNAAVTAGCAWHWTADLDNVIALLKRDGWTR